MDGPTPKRKRPGRLWALLGPAALVAGFGFGALAHSSGATALAGALEPIGALWVNALRVAVVPLSACLVVTGMLAIPSGKALGRWGLYSLLVFAGLLIAGALITYPIVEAYLGAFGPGGHIQPSGAYAPSTANGYSFLDWLSGLIPSNHFESLVKGDLLPVVVLSMLFGLALRSLEEERSRPVTAILAAIRDALLVYIRWVVAALPIGAFCLAYAFAARSGFGVAAATAHFVAVTFAMMLLFVALMYVTVAVWGRVRLRRFAAELWPAQEIAIGSRSSLATLPALIEGSRNLGLPEPAHGAVLPMAASLLKVNRPVSAITKLLFVAAMFGITLDAGHVMSFVLTVFLLSVATPGVPSAGSGPTLGAYLAAGLPLEGVLLLDATDSLTDIVKTATNVTGYMTSAVLVSRFAESRAQEPGQLGISDVPT